MGQVSVDELANAMFELISSAYKKKNLKPMDVTKAMIEKYGDACDKKLCKEAIRQLRRCVEQDYLFAPAWDALASAYSRLGRQREAEEATQQAKDARKELWKRQVVAEIRGQMFWS